MELKVFFSCKFSLLLASLIFFCLTHPSRAAGKYNITAVFAFGDSTIDTGNNNVLNTLVRADHKPYGQDFPGGVPTGRFSNGYLVIDFLAAALGLKSSVPPFSVAHDLSAAELATGVCFASAGSGYDLVTATGDLVISMGQQLQNFEEYVGLLRNASGGGAAGEAAAKMTVENALYLFSAGSNDWLRSYLSNPVRRSIYSVPAYAVYIIGQIRILIEDLYKLGGRKIALVGLPPIGCTPYEITKSLFKPFFYPSERTCVQLENENAAFFNSKLIAAIKDMNASFKGINIQYFDIYNPIMDMVNNRTKYGFTVTTLGCCGSGSVELGPLCNEFQFLCPDPSNYMFWDAMHPTEATYKAITDKFSQSVLPKFQT